MNAKECNRIFKIGPLKFVKKWRKVVDVAAPFFLALCILGPLVCCTYCTVIFEGHVEVKISLDKHAMGKSSRKSAILRY